MKILLAFFIAFGAAAAPEPEIIPPGRSVESRALRPLRIAKTVYLDRHNNMQTAFVANDEDTAELISTFANGTFRSMRVSAPGVVQQPISYRGWPYILDHKGRLYAMDLNWSTFYRNKIPIVIRRITTTFRYAASTGVGLFLFAWLSNITGDSQYGAVVAGTAGFFTVYVSDAVMTLLLPAHHRPDYGGNFFHRVIATDVSGVIEDPSSGEFQIRYRTPGPDKKTLLSELAPAYTKKTRCIYNLTRLLNDGYWGK